MRIHPHLAVAANEWPGNSIQYWKYRANSDRDGGDAHEQVTTTYNASPFIIDIGDIEKFPDNLANPLPPANVMAHEFVEQYEIQVRGVKDYQPAHRVGIGTENVANVERYGSYQRAPMRYANRADPGVFENNVQKSVSIIYSVQGPELAGRTEANVTMNYTYPGDILALRSANNTFSVNVEWVAP